LHSAAIGIKLFSEGRFMSCSARLPHQRPIPAGILNSSVQAMTPTRQHAPRAWTPEQEARLAAATERVSGIVDKLGKGLDPGIVQAVAMLTDLGINLLASCEGHPHWATGGPYIDAASPKHSALSAALRLAKEDPVLSDEAQRLQTQLRRENVKEGVKMVPLLDAFYQSRTVGYEQRLTLHFYGPGITRLESGGVGFLPAVDLDGNLGSTSAFEKLDHFQREMALFSDFLVTYEPPTFASQAAPSSARSSKVVPRHCP
jgi:hypothetical protein